ncbi:MAG: Imm49 family immunity protein [Bacteroidota bacterium]
MPLRDLSEIGDDLATYLEFYIGEAQTATGSADMAAAAMTVSAYYEGLALTELLLDANTDAFAHHLTRSGQTRVWLLDRVERTPEAAKALKASYLRPFVDAVAAGQWGVARAIATRETAEWTPRHEYEDDFAYAHALHRIVRGDGSEAARSVLDRFEGALDGLDDPRLPLCRVLLDPDQAAADEAFHDLLDQHADRVETLKEESEYWEEGDALIYPSVFVFVEGLAWLALLERAGLAMNDEYRFCPSLARRLDPAPLDPRPFPSMPL